MAQRLRLVSDCQVIVKETFIDEQFELDQDLDYVDRIVLIRLALSLYWLKKLKL